MRKHRSFFKAFLLLTTISAAVPSACYGAEPAENFYERGQRLLTMDLNLRAEGSYLTHQASSISLQERIRMAARGDA